MWSLKQYPETTAWVRPPARQYQFGGQFAGFSVVRRGGRKKYAHKSFVGKYPPSPVHLWEPYVGNNSRWVYEGKEKKVKVQKYEQTSVIVYSDASVLYWDLVDSYSVRVSLVYTVVNLIDYTVYWWFPLSLWC
jgi:hypothetical protein